VNERLRQHNCPTLHGVPLHLTPASGVPVYGMILAPLLPTPPVVLVLLELLDVALLLLLLAEPGVALAVPPPEAAPLDADEVLPMPDAAWLLEPVTALADEAAAPDDDEDVDDDDDDAFAAMPWDMPPASASMPV